MALGKLWAGSVAGTNTGNLFVKLDGEDKALKGTLHFNEPGVPILVYEVIGVFDGKDLLIEGKSKTEIPGVAIGALKAKASLQPNGNLFGEWETDIGSAGTFILYPHSLPPAKAVPQPEQLHTPRHNFRPIQIDREQFTALADYIQRDFTKSRVVVTFDAQSHYLEQFRNLKIKEGRSHFVKLFAREPDADGFEKSITVEFGPMYNFATVQSVDESVALGELEKLKREIRPFERVFSSQQFGAYFTQFMLICALIFLPSLESLTQRAILMFAVVGLMFGINWVNGKYLTHALIYLGKRKENGFAKFLQNALVWLTGIAGTVIAGLLAAYLKGALHFTAP
jgi:hypothetical protein